MPAITNPTNLGTGQNKAASTVTITTVAAAAAGGAIFVSVYSSSATVTPTVTDAAGNTYVQVGTRQAGPGGTGFVYLFADYDTLQLNSGQTISISGTTLYAASAWYFSAGVEEGNYLGLLSATGTSTAPTVTYTGLVSTNTYMAVGIVVTNGPSGDTFTQATNYATPPNRIGTTGGSATSNYTIAGGFDQFTGATSKVYNPTLGTSRAWRDVIYIFKQGTDFSDTRTETNTATDSGTSSLVFGGSATESDPVTDSFDATASFSTDQDETETVDDAASSAATLSSDRSETSTVTESATGGASLDEDRTETNTTTDSGSAVYSTDQSKTEATNAVDAADAIGGKPVDATEASSIQDIITNVATFVTNASETVRKNLFPSSTDTFSGFIQSNASLSFNATTAPDGTNTASKLIEDTSVTAIHRVYAQPQFNTGVTYTVSLYAKADTRTKLVVFHEEAAGRAGLNLDLSAGTKTDYLTGTGSLVGSSITNEGNGWYRAAFTFTASVTSATLITVRLVDAAGNLTYTGDGVSGLFIWGGQFEVSPAVTTYSNPDKLEVYVGSNVTSQTRTETTTVTESETATYSTSQSRTETNTATESATSQADFRPSITETSTVTETETGNYTTTQTRTETVTVNETEDSSFAVPTVITETGTPAESSTSLVLFGGLVTESLQRTNYVLNTSMQGAVVGVLGSGGSLPTGWGWGSVTGLTRQVTATGTNSYGETYIELRLSGTNTSGVTGYPDIYPVPTNQNITAAVGDVFNASIRVDYVAGSATAGFAGSSRSLSIAEYTSANAYLAGNGTTTVNTNGGFATISRTMANASIAKTAVYLEMSLLNGSTVDVTLRISIPQFERGSVASEFIPSASTPGTAGAGTRQSNVTNYQPAITEALQRTNLIPNSTMVGASAGVNPTGWAPFAPAGMSTAVVATGTENGYAYVDYRISGTNSTGSIQFPSIRLMGADAVGPLAAQNETYTGQAYIKLISGTNPGIRFSVRENTLAGAYISETTIVTPNSIIGDNQFVSLSRTMVSASTGRTNLYLYTVANNGDTLDFTFRIAAPQFETGSTATEFIPTSGTIASAGAGTKQSSSAVFSPSISEAAQRTNLIANSTLNGATSSTLPTGWAALTTQTGIAAAVVGNGTDTVTGYPYLDVRFNGTATGAGGGLRINYTATTTTTPAVDGESFTSSAYFGLAAGAYPAGRNAQLVVYGRNSAGSALIGYGVTINTIVTNSVLQKITNSVTFTSQPTLAYVNPFFELIVNTGDIVDFTIRIAAPQLERGLVSTEYIPTSGTIASAGAGTTQANTLSTNKSITEAAVRTNYIRNNTMVGAVPGTPGSSPNYWGVGVNGSGLTLQLVSTGIEDGINYIDYRFSGTTGTATEFVVSPEPALGVAATSGQTWTGSFFVRMIAGSTANILNARTMTRSQNSSNGQLEKVYGTNVLSQLSVNSIAHLRPTATLTIADPATVAVQTYFGLSHLSGVAIDITLRFGMPQLEMSAVETEVIPTSGTIASAGAASTQSNVTTFVASATESALRTNLIPNSTMQGGTVSTFPTGWSAGSASGVNVTVVGYGTEDGIPYLDVNWAGTSTAINYPDVKFLNEPTGPLASVNEFITGSVIVRVISGNATNLLLSIRENDNVGGYLANSSGAMPADSSDARFTYTRQLTNVATVRTGLRILKYTSLSEVVNFTLRIKSPQLERGSLATEYIPTSGTPASSGAGTTQSRVATYVADVSDSSPVTESETNSTVFATTRTEANTATESATTQTNFVSSTTETATVTETETNVVTTPVSVTEAITRTNYIRNSTLTGAVTGTPGTLPTNWGISNAGTLSRSITTGTINNINYIDIRFFGTSSTTQITIPVENNNVITTFVGDTLTYSVYTAIIAGTTTNVNQIGLFGNLFDSSFTYIGGALSKNVFNRGSTLVQESITSTISTANSAFIVPIVYLGINSGAAIDITIRIAAPQLERSSVVTEYIPTSGTAVTTGIGTLQLGLATYPVSITELDDVTDSVNRGATVPGLATDNNPLTENADAIYGIIPLEQLETATITENVNGIASKDVTRTDASTLIEMQDYSYVIDRSHTEINTVTANETVLATFNPTISETTTATETRDVSYTANAFISEVTEAITTFITISSYNPPITETVIATDTLAGNYVTNQSITEIALLFDLIFASKPNQLALSSANGITSTAKSSTNTNVGSIKATSEGTSGISSVAKATTKTVTGAAKAIASGASRPVAKVVVKSNKSR